MPFFTPSAAVVTLLPFFWPLLVRAAAAEAAEEEEDDERDEGEEDKPEEAALGSPHHTCRLSLTCRRRCVPISCPQAAAAPALPPLSANGSPTDSLPAAHQTRGCVLDIPRGFRWKEIRTLLLLPPPLPPPPLLLLLVLVVVMVLSVRNPAALFCTHSSTASTASAWRRVGSPSIRDRKSAPPRPSPPPPAASSARSRMASASATCSVHTG